MDTRPVVYIVDDDDVVCDYLTQLLERAGIASQAFSSGELLLDAWHDLIPGCFVLDYHLPAMSGLQLIEEIRSRGSTVPFLIITGFGTVPMTVDAMKNGAVTVIEKPFKGQRFIEQVRELITHSEHARVESQRQEELQNRVKLLTTREREIMDLVVGGNLTKQIAKRLGISTKTVEVHRSHITKKLGVESVAQLVKMVMSIR
ncbi:MAG: response regulator transcription factor [Pirellulaceae bacterium]|nr:response regulator transcription factor [Pirellulaceae bacterium]